VIKRYIFILVHLIIKPRALFLYYRLRDNERLTNIELADRQKQEVVRYLSFCRTQVPYYTDKIPDLNFFSGDECFYSYISSIPLLKKEDVIANRKFIELEPKKVGKFKYGQTGGSTGEPLKYRISSQCNDSAFAILYRGLGRGGYKLGDRLAVMAGGSLITKNKSLKTKLVSFFMNTRKYSSYGVSDAIFQEYYEDLVKWKPYFIRGYASSLYEFAKFVDRKNYNLNFKSVFTTAEMLFEHQRKFIEKVFNAKVFNGYGLNDGGVTAFECEMQDGFHIDLERGYLEVVDDDGKPVFDQVGRIVATSFLNKATPFVRYVTGDLGIISTERCKCGSPYPLLKSITGRTTDVLKINNKIVGVKSRMIVRALFKKFRMGFMPLLHRHDGWFGVQS
jgi:phenylacetate-CoA ligase